MIRYNIIIPDDWLPAIHAAAEARGLSVSELIRGGIWKQIPPAAREGLEREVKRGRPKSEKSGKNA